MLWAGALLLALAYLAVDSQHRLRSIAFVTAFATADAPAPVQDPTSPSGYERGQHRIILPIAGTDGYHWAMQTERMLADGSVRIRHTDVDNAPHGREVHWASPLRWWLGGLALAQAALRPTLDAGRSVQFAAPVANAIMLALLLVLFVPLAARWFGAPAGALLALAWVTVFPLYELFLAGILDHHGMVAAACLVGLMCLARGTVAHEQHWFAAAGFAWGVGMWISASTMIPIIAATGLAALLTHDHAGTSPRAWRSWAVAGSITCIAAWLVEYFPGALNMRLEVNHPLYAVAWLAGGDLIVRLAGAQWHTGRDRAMIAAGALALLLPALLIVSLGPTVFHLMDPVLRAVHQQDILEFQGLFAQLARIRPIDLLVQGSTLPALLLIPASAMMWQAAPPSRAPALWRACTTACAAVGAAYLHATLFVLLHALVPAIVAHALALPVAVAVTAAVIGWWKLATPDMPSMAQLVTITIPAATLFGLTLLQMRWLSMGVAAMLALMVIAPAMTWARPPTRAAKRSAWAYLVALLLPLPLLSALIPWRVGYPAAGDLPQIATRHIAHSLRGANVNDDIVFAAPATTTTWLTWFAGGRGIGTLYWENLDGMQALADIFDAADADDAYRHLADRGATHLVVPAWEGRPPRWLNPADPPEWLQPVEIGMPSVSGIRLPPAAVYRIRAPLISN